eukprot:Skav201920  [mRNA]  locus=scaffold3992:238085:239133:+ [translate_table: standard]
MTPFEVGHAYELIVTTRGGLCRYRLGDVVRVVGKMGQMPLVELQGRAGKSFKLCGEDLPEFDFVEALAKSPVAAKVRGAMVLETSAAHGNCLHFCVEDTSSCCCCWVAGKSTGLAAPSFPRSYTIQNPQLFPTRSTAIPGPAYQDPHFRIGWHSPWHASSSSFGWPSP